MEQLDGYTQSQIDDLRALKDGWFGGTGRAFNHDWIDWLSEMLATHSLDRAVLPGIYPLQENSVVLEWDTGHGAASLVINDLTRLGCWSVCDCSDRSSYRKDLDLNSPDDWHWIAKQFDK